jgi:hypothetical protein
MKNKTKKPVTVEDFWCTCNPTETDFENAVYYNDGEHPKCEKHCWACHNCGKIIQVG